MIKKLFYYIRVQKYGTTIKFQTINQITVHIADLQATKEILIEKNFPKPHLLYNLVASPYGIRYIIFIKLRIDIFY